MQIIKIGKNDAGQRLDSFLKKLMPAAPYSLLYKYLRTNKLKLNGKKPDFAVRLCEGDEIKFFGDESLIQKNGFTPISHSLDIVYEDENILIINKPPKMGCQPDIGHPTGSLVDAVKSYLFDKGEYNPDMENSFAPALCNRIDFNTRGIVIAAKNAAALRIINEKIRAREIRRFYICTTLGCPKEREGVIRKRIEKDTRTNKSRTVEKGGRYAETHYRVLSFKDGRALIEAEIITGLSHQIRTHLSSIGCPIVGDSKYGGGSGGQQLTSYKTVMDFKSDAGILNYLKGKEFAIELK